AEKVNGRVAGLDEFANGLQAALAASTTAGAALQPILTGMIDLKFPPKVAGNPQVLDAIRARLLQQYSTAANAIAGTGGAASATAFIDTLLLVESTARLEETGPMRIYGITASNSELASAPLHAFQGFIDRAYRQHDYDMGRHKVREFIQAVNTNNDQLGPINYPAATQPIAIDNKLDGLQMGGIPASRREQVRDKIHKRINDAMKAEHLNFLERKGIDWLVLNKFLNLMFEL